METFKNFILHYLKSCSDGAGCGCDEDGNCWQTGDPTSGGWIIAIGYYSQNGDCLTLAKTTRVLFENDNNDGTWYDFLEADMRNDDDNGFMFCDSDAMMFELDWVTNEEFRLFD